jgi:hypothetical protein
MIQRRAVHRFFLFLPGALVAPVAASWSQMSIPKTPSTGVRGGIEWAEPP